MRYEIDNETRIGYDSALALSLGGCNPGTTYQKKSNYNPIEQPVDISPSLYLEEIGG